jgi:hypothetical protein
MARLLKPCPGCGTGIEKKSKQCKACQRTHTFPLSGQARDEYGCIMTFEAADGARLTLHRTGSARESVRALCEIALERDPSYRLLSYSTPETIYGDMRGARADVVGSQGKTQRSTRPEAQALGRVGLIDLLHARFHTTRATGEPRQDGRTGRGRG